MNPIIIRVVKVTFFLQEYFDLLLKYQSTNVGYRKLYSSRTVSLRKLLLNYVFLAKKQASFYLVLSPRRNGHNLKMCK